MKIFGRNFDDEKLKKNVYTAVLVALIAWFIFRFVMLAIESRMVIFNPVRDANVNGTLVETVVATKQNGIINFPLAIKNNRSYVSDFARAKLRAGQNISDGGVIIAVSNSLDLDSGMYIVQTRGADDGVHNVQIPCSGYFMPSYAVRNGQVMIADSDVAHARDVNIAARDSDVVCISDGINDGDIVILSRVSKNQKIKK